MVLLKEKNAVLLKDEELAWQKAERPDMLRANEPVIEKDLNADVWKVTKKDWKRDAVPAINEGLKKDWKNVRKNLDVNVSDVYRSIRIAVVQLIPAVNQ